MNLLNIDDYKDKKIYVVHNEILSKVLELVYFIIQEKKIDMDKYSYIDGEYEKIYHMFYYDVDLCSGARYLIRKLGMEYNNEKAFHDEIETWIRTYNELVIEMNHYLEVKKEVEDKGFENVYGSLLEDLKKLVIEMLDYKKKSFNHDLKLGSLIDKTDQYYHYFHYTFYCLKNALIGRIDGENIEEESKSLNSIEKIIYLRSYYNYIKDNYKKYAFFIVIMNLKMEKLLGTCTLNIYIVVMICTVKC